MKKLFKFLYVPVICSCLLIIVYLNFNKWTDAISAYILMEPEIMIPESNDYQKNSAFLFVQETNSFTPYSKGDIKNIFYTIVNNGWKEFTFYCPKEYTKCLDDMKEISQDQDLLTHLNNYVHPYNGFSSVKTMISENGEIIVSIDYFYTEEQKKIINQKVDELYETLLTSDMDTETKILTIHDYIINTTKYDIERNNDGKSSYQSYIAYGPLIEGVSTCNGYTDAMALFLEKLEIPNFKVAMTPESDEQEGHVWNALYLNNKWLHLDLTWDDPVSRDRKDYLQHKYFLITTNQLKEADSGEVNVIEHQFKDNIYLELKDNNL